MSSDLPLIIVIFFIIESFLNILQKKQLRINFSKYFISSNLILIILFSLSTFNLGNLKKNQSLISSIKKKDFQFLDQDSKIFIKNSDVYFKDEKCIFNFTTDISFPYFIKKKHVISISHRG